MVCRCAGFLIGVVELDCYIARRHGRGDQLPWRALRVPIMSIGQLLPTAISDKATSRDRARRPQNHGARPLLVRADLKGALTRPLAVEREIPLWLAAFRTSSASALRGRFTSWPSSGTDCIAYYGRDNDGL